MDSITNHLLAALDAGEYGGLGDVIDQAELENPTLFDRPQWPHAVHMLAHIYNLRLEDARFMYKRTPESIQESNDELKAAFTVLQCLWNHNYPSVWPALSYPWSVHLQGLAAAIRSRLQESCLDLASRTYSDISKNKLAALCGTTEDDIAAIAMQRGWTQDLKTGHLMPGSSSARTQVISREDDLERLARYVVFLQTGDIAKEADMVADVGENRNTE